MSEEEFRTDNLNNKNEKPESENQVDNFPKTTKLLDTKLKEKKDKILTVLKNDELKKLFEEALSSPEKRQKLINELLENDNTEGVIFANLPEWYAYNVSTNEVVKTEEKKDNDYTWATIMDQKTEQAKTDTEQAKTDTGKAVETKNLDESILVMRQAIEERDKLVAKYQSLDLKTNKSSEKFQTVKKQLENNWTLNQLRQNHDEQFINDYILVQTTLQELKSNPTSYEQNDISYFDKLVKHLNNACNVPDTNLNSFSTENIAQTRTELFDGEIWNKSLIKVKQSNTESHNYSEVFSNMRDNEIFEKYGKFLEWDLKKCWDKYENNYYWFFNEFSLLNKQKSQGQTLTEEEEMILSLPWMIEWIKKEMDNNTKNMMEELCIISQIKWMYMCMWEWENFSLNKANEIKAEEIDNKNLILTLNGHIDWVDFAIRQNVKDPNGRLQIYQKLARDKDTFVVGWENKFVDSNFILPSQDEIFESIKETVTSGESLANSNNPEDYIKNLQENIMWKIEDKYENTKYVHHYMQEQVKWEKIVDSTLWFIGKISPSTVNDEILMWNISQERNSDLYDFMKILKFNIDNSTDVEKDKLNKCIEKILEITDNYKNNNGIEDFVTLKYPPVIEHYLKDGAWLNGWDEDSRLKSLSDLFRYYSEKSKDTRANSEWIVGTPSKMIINDLYVDLFEFQWGQSETASTRDMNQSNKFTLQSNEEEAKKESDNAESLLIEGFNNSEIWRE